MQFLKLFVISLFLPGIIEASIQTRKGLKQSLPAESFSSFKRRDRAERRLARQAKMVNAESDSKNMDANEALFVAIDQSNVTAVQTALARGADINVQDAKGRTPLHQACGLAEWDIAKVLIRHGANVLIPDQSEHTPLHATCNYRENEQPTPNSSNIKKQIAMVKLLIRSGANLNAVNAQGFTPLHFGVQNVEMVNIIAERCQCKS